MDSKTTLAQFPWLPQCEVALGTAFSNPLGLVNALTHKSFARFTRLPIHDNERLEFFGDAVVKLVVSEYLYNAFPEYSEGELTKLRAQLVSDKNLAFIAEKIGVGTFLQMSNGEINTGGRHRQSNLANAMEAVLGAYYIDSGLLKVQEYLVGLLERYKSELLSQDYVTDYKTTLQEHVQRKKGRLPHYDIDSELGPEHDKLFTVTVDLYWASELRRFSGEGRSKKSAEQQAAKAALYGLGLIG